MDRAFIRSLLVEESFAYGFTIAFWGTGLLLVDEFGLLGTLGVLAYAGGAVTGFGLLALASFGSAVDTLDTEESPTYHVLAGIHYLAALVPILTAHGLFRLSVGRTLSVFLAGALVTIGYNVFAALEEAISMLVRRLERRYVRDD